MSHFDLVHFKVCLCGADMTKYMFPIGALDFLQKPVVAFVRLADSMVMDSALESPIPIRFVFMLVGPKDSGLDFTESGRAMGALMADWVRENRNTALALRVTTSGLLCVVQVKEGSCVLAPIGLLSGGLPSPN